MLKPLALAHVLACTIALAGCQSEHVTYATIPIVSAEPALPSAIRQGKKRLMAVERLYTWCDQGQLRVQVSAGAATGGWTDAGVNRLDVDGGTIVFEAVARPPRGSVDSRRVDLLTFEYKEPAVRNVTRVRVLGQMNEMQSDIQLPYAC